MTRLAFSLAVAMTVAPAAHAIDVENAVAAFLDGTIRGWAAEPVLLDAVTAQNGTTAGFDAAHIDALDQEWRAQVGQSPAPVIDPVLGNPAADFLRAQVMASGGMVTEVFVMDSVGLNVAASGVTSDYWQGDEAKFTETYARGPGAVHVSDVEFDESTQSYSVQVSIPLTDPATGAVIGAMTVGLNAEAFL